MTDVSLTTAANESDLDGTEEPVVVDRQLFIFALGAVVLALLLVALLWLF